MSLSQLIDILQGILDRFPDSSSAPVDVEQWDDNAYDGVPIVGVRLGYEVETNGDQRWSVYIIRPN